MTTLITVCICTYRRPMLARTLDSIARQELPEHLAREVVVVDNDGAGSARTLVEGFASKVPFPVSYAVEPRKGLSHARNRTLEQAGGDWLALIDDDEIAEPDWLSNLFECAIRFKADAVVGAVQPRFDEPPAQWVTSSRFFDLDLPATGTRIGMGEALSGNTLLRGAFVRGHDLRFDPDFNTTGGEDTDFFRRFVGHGGIIVSAQEARVHESVPRERTTSAYLVRRSLRVGEIYARVTHRNGGMPALVVSGVRAAMNVVAAAGLTVASLPAGRNVYYRYYLLLVRNLGKFRYYLGLPPIEMYPAAAADDAVRTTSPKGVR